MRSATFILLGVVCVITPTLAASNNPEDGTSVMGALSSWWSPPRQEIPKGPAGFEPVEKLQNSTPDSKPKETVWALLDKLEAVPENTLERINPAKLGDMAWKAKEEAKQKARRELCELIKACVKSMFWG